MNKSIWQARIFFLTLLVSSFLVLIQEGFSTADTDCQIKLTAALGLLSIIYILISSYGILRRIDCYMIFMALSFFFMFGEQLLYLVGVRNEDMWIYRNLLRKETIYTTGFFVIYTYLTMHLGYSLTLHRRINNIIIPSENIYDCSRKMLMKVGKVIAIIVSIPTMYILVRKIMLSIELGYAEMLNSMVIEGNEGGNTIISVLSTLMIPALLAMFIAKNKTSKWPWILIIIYIVLYMLSGSRLDSFCLICGLFYATILVHIRLKRKTFVIILSICLAIAMIYIFVSHSRGSSDEKKDVLTQLVEDNPISLILKETGFTFCVTGIVVERSPSEKAHLCGKSYLSGVLYILPNALTGNYYKKTPEVDKEFSSYISTGGGIGSSFIAEGYYNFGMWSLLLFLVYGYLFGVLCDKIERSVNSCNFPKIFIYIGIFCIVVLYVRSDTRTFFRNLVWTYVPIYFFSMSSHNLKKRKVSRVAVK